MSDTPRTDNFLAYLATGVVPDQIPHSWVQPLVEWARGLERECASYEAREVGAAYCSNCSWLNDCLNTNRCLLDEKLDGGTHAANVQEPKEG